MVTGGPGEPCSATACTRIWVSAEVADVMRKVRRQPLLEIGVTADIDGAAKLLQQHSAVEKIEESNGRLMVTMVQGTQDFSDLPTLLVQAGYKLTVFKEDEINLETAFMALTKGITA